MKSTTLLERQHRNIHELCEAVEHGSPSIRESLLPQLANDLAAHLRIEEELFYPETQSLVADARRSGIEAYRRAARAHVEHLLGLEPAGREFDGRASELRSLFEAHIDEEEHALFPAVEEGMSPADNRALAVRMMHLHHQSVEAGYERTSLIPRLDRRPGDPGAAPHVRA